MDEFRYDETLETLGAMREHLRHLEESDYVTAYYKGYSSNGLTLEEVNEEITTISNNIEILEHQLNEEEW